VDFRLVEAEQVENLDGKESDDASSGSVVEGEDDVGNAGGEHGED